MTTSAMIDAYSLGIKQVRSKPVLVWAVEITRGNCNEILNWVRDLGGHAQFYDPSKKTVREHDHAFWVLTLENWIPAKIGDFLIRGTEGEFYPIKPQVYLNRYEDVVQEGYQDDSN